MTAARGSRAGRTGRGLAAAAFATFVAALSHSVAQAEPAPMLGVLLALVLAAPVCVALAGRRLSWLRLSAGVVLSQAVFHTLLMIGVGEATSTAMTPAGDHGMHAATLAATGAAHGAVHTDAGMWAAHVLAAAVTIIAFGAGEQALRRLLQLVSRRLVAWRVVTLPVLVRAPRPLVFGRLITDPGFRLLSVVSRRGPPLAA